MDIDTVYDRLEEADAALGEVHRIISTQPDVDIGENGNLRLLRSLRAKIGELRDEIESTGLTGD